MVNSTITSALGAAVVGMASIIGTHSYTALTNVAGTQVHILETLGRIDERLKNLETNK
jgi:hypothetical protein